MKTCVWYEEYIALLDRALRNVEAMKVIRDATDRFFAARKEATSRIKRFKELVEKLREIRREAIERVDELIKMVKESVEFAGGAFHFARDKDEANGIVLKICEEHDAKLVVKSKSMTTEEIDLNNVLESRGIEVVETDLGEFIIQQLKEKPSHLVAPAIHIPRKRIADMFSSILGEDVPPEIPAITMAARRVLREKFFKADIGISGTNAIAADTGTIFLITNEGNGGFVTNAPPVHICIAGIEKLNPTVEDAFIVSRLIPVFATGQLMPSYISLITGPSRTGDVEFVLTIGVHGPKEVHLVLLDNGRTKVLRDPDFRDALMCVRCGSCLNVCPVYRTIGGTYGYRYVGGIGIILTAFTEGLEKCAGPAFACTLCGKCTLACPLELDIPGMIEKLRKRLQRNGYAVPRHKQILENILNYGNPFGETPH